MPVPLPPGVAESIAEVKVTEREKIETKRSSNCRRSHYRKFDLFHLSPPQKTNHQAALSALERAVEEAENASPSSTATETAAAAGTAATPGTEASTAAAASLLEAALAAVAAAEAAAGRGLSSTGIDKELSAARRALRDHERRRQR